MLPLASFAPRCWPRWETVEPERWFQTARRSCTREKAKWSPRGAVGRKAGGDRLGAALCSVPAVVDQREERNRQPRAFGRMRDYVAEFKQLEKCYRLLAESAERKAQFDAPQN